MLPMLRPSALVTMAQRIEATIQQHREVWTALFTMARSSSLRRMIAGRPRTDATKVAPEQPQRTRIAGAQKYCRAKVRHRQSARESQGWA